MLAASDAWQFERAAVLRERLAALEWLAGRLERFHAGADRLSFVYRPAGREGEERVYLVRRGTVRAECAAPATAGEGEALDALARRVFTAPDPADLPTHDLDEFYLVASWFRRHPEELARTAAARRRPRPTGGDRPGGD
jgi:excinuclease ABC subunit C